MQSDVVSFGGEFRDPQREAEYLSQHVQGAVRHVRAAFLWALGINVLFLVNDWSMLGLPGFREGLAARTVIVLASLVGAIAARRCRDMEQLVRVCLGWSWPVIGACAVLVMPHTESALFITFVLPNIFYLLLPMPFRWCVVTGVGCSVAVGAGYILAAPLGETSVGLGLGLVTINVVLMLVLARSNRLHRAEWTATGALRHANAELAEHREMLQSIVDAVPTPLLMTDRDGLHLIRANAAARRFFGDAMVGDWRALERFLGWRDMTRLSLALDQDGRVSEFETRLAFADGSRRDVLLEATLASVLDTEVVLTVIVDISSRKEMEANLERLATTDALTGLPNRASFFSSASVEIKRALRYQRPLGVVMVDIDLFKRINDTFGHEAGDSVLRGFAVLCRSVMRDQDVVARLGGEEFGILLPESDRDSSMVLAERLRAGVERLRFDDMSISLSISVGVSRVLDGELVVDAALSRADRALYIAKRTGRNQVVYAEDCAIEPSAAAAG